MHKFLVIDDLKDRKEMYSRTFDFLELDYAFTSEEFKEKITQKYDGYFVDMIYSEESFKEFSIQEILEKIPDKKPLFLISSNWATAIDDMKMRYLRSSGKFNYVLGYLSWKNFESSEKVELAKDFIREQINNYYGFAYDVLDDNQSISILQISDLEFGNPEQEDNIDAKARMIIREVRKTLKKLDIQTEKVDFICVCGDVGYYGEKEEYTRAKQWLKTLGEQLLLNSNFENMLIVPGNHDYNYSSAAGSFYKTERYVEDEENKIRYVDRKPAKLEYHEQAMYNFAKFVYELTGDSSYLINPYKPIIKRMYENYGLDFILLNPIKIGKNKKFKYGISGKEWDFLLSNFMDEESQERCNIVLSHLEATQYNLKDYTSDSLYKDMRNVINELGIKGWLYGHSHDERYVTTKELGKRDVFVSRTSSLMLKNSQHCEGATNGFTVIKLYRENGLVNKISYYNGNKEKTYDSPFKKED